VPPENFASLSVQFIESIKEELVKAIAMVRQAGHQPEDFVFVAATQDNNSQEVAALALGLYGEDREPLVGVAAVQRDWLFNRLEPIYQNRDGRTYEALRDAEPGKITLWLVINNWPLCAKMTIVAGEPVPCA
jgi:hypothetical protein